MCIAGQGPARGGVPQDMGAELYKQNAHPHISFTVCICLKQGRQRCFQHHLVTELLMSIKSALELAHLCICADEMPKKSAAQVV